MTHAITRLLHDAIRQLFGWNKVRAGKLSVTYWATIQMKEHRLDLDAIEDVFRHGRKVTTIVQDYQNYSISIGYRWMRIKSAT